jgi:hypothetical protein
MEHLPEAKTRRPTAPCRGARRLLTVAILAATLVILAAGADWLLRVPRQDRSAGTWMKALSLSAPALHAAGSPLRHPETVHPAVDLRFSPGLETAP